MKEAYLEVTLLEIHLAPLGGSAALGPACAARRVATVHCAGNDRTPPTFNDCWYGNRRMVIMPAFCRSVPLTLALASRVDATGGMEPCKPDGVVPACGGGTGW